MEYELMFLFKPLTNEDIKERTFPKIVKMVKELGGEIKFKGEPLGKRLLAYDIKGHKEGYYLLTHLSLPASALPKLNEKLNLTTEILRFLSIRKDRL